MIPAAVRMPPPAMGAAAARPLWFWLRRRWSFVAASINSFASSSLPSGLEAAMEDFGGSKRLVAADFMG